LYSFLQSSIRILASVSVQNSVMASSSSRILALNDSM